MCGKFTALASWRQVVEFSRPLTGGADETVTYGVMRMLPVIVFDRETGTRKVVPMRWGFPSPKNWRVPQPIHARAEGIETTRVFADAFRGGQRGIVVMQTFNEGPTLPNGKTEQWTIDPSDGVPRGFAFVWRRFEIEGLPAPLLACVMVTVPASKAIAETILHGEQDPRMPAILEDAGWATWLGEKETALEDVKAVLKTMEGVNWRMAKESKPKNDRNTTRPR